MNEDRIVQALTIYQPTEESLKETVGVLSEELGANWTESVFEQLGGLPIELKDKLNQVFNYYAALMAWQETSGYLEQKEPLDETIQERLPVLKHWLDFFGEEGEKLYTQLEQKISASPDEASSKGEPTKPQEDSTQPKEEEPLSSSENQTEEVVSVIENDSVIDLNSPQGFIIQKAKKEIELLDAVQAWLSARCLQLNNMEVFAYPYYGFVVDLMRQTVKDIQAVLDLEDKTILPKFYEGGEEAIVRKKQAVEADIETAVQNCESATTALIDNDINMDEVRKTLGNLDESTEPEYLGPAPDGFELLQDSDTPLDENAVKEQYQKLEKEVLAETESEKKTSQNAKNSVQKKLSFSFKPKKQ